MSRQISEILTELGETQTEVISVHVLKLGCLCFSPFEDPTINTRFPLTRLRETSKSYDRWDRKPEQIYGALLDGLEQHSNIFDINRHDEEAHDRSIFRENGILIDGDVCSLRVGLPRRLQKFSSEHLPGEPSIENFNVLLSGSLFGAYSEVEDYPTDIYIGHEFRELARTQVERTTDFKAPLFGPAPIHPDICIVTVKDQEQNRGTRVYGHRGDAVVVIGESTPIKDVVASIFYTTRGTIRDFYKVQLTRSSLLD